MKNPLIYLKCTGCGHTFQDTLDWFEQVGQKPHSHYDNVACEGRFKETSPKVAKESPAERTARNEEAHAAIERVVKNMK